MKKFILILTVLLMAWGATPAFSYPTLQLDISDSVYVAGDEETVYATGNQFTLYALLNGDSSLLDEEYYISAAVVSMPSEGIPETAPDLGTIKIGDQTISVTSDMIYGTPPADEDVKDLATHGVFPTYYFEKTITFDAANTVAAYNVEDNPGAFDTSTSADSLYYAAFDVDISDLAAGYGIHFDLYHTDGSKVDIKAPFSHDAQGDAIAGGTPVTGTTPEPATMLLLGSGLVGLVGLKRRKNS